MTCHQHLKTGLDAINSTAARQLLIYRPSIPNISSSLYTSFQNEINAPNFGMPRTTKNISLSNGSIDAASYTGFSSGANLIHIDIRRKDIINNLDGVSPFWEGVLNALFTLNGVFGRIQADVWAAPSSTSVYHEFSRLIVKGSFKFIPILWADISYEAIGVKPIDNAPGGLYNVGNFTGAIGDFPGTVDINATHFSFIPTVSAAALTGNDKLNLNYNIRSNNPQGSNKSLFTNLQGPTYAFAPNVYNENHIGVTKGGAYFLADVLLSETDGLKNVSTLISNNSYNIATNSTYEAKRLIGHNIAVENGAYIGINAYKQVGLKYDNNGWPTNANIAASVSPCPFYFQPEITLKNGGELIVGNTSNNLVGHLVFKPNTELIAESGSTICIGSNSSITFMKGSTLNINNNVDIVIESGGLLKVEGEVFLNTTPNTLVVSGGGIIYLLQ